jgi:hypothetical protein
MLERALPSGRRKHLAARPMTDYLLLWHRCSDPIGDSCCFCKQLIGQVLNHIRIRAATVPSHAFYKMDMTSLGLGPGLAGKVLRF